MTTPFEAVFNVKRDDSDEFRKEVDRVLRDVKIKLEHQLEVRWYTALEEEAMCRKENEKLRKENQNLRDFMSKMHELLWDARERLQKQNDGGR